MSCSVFSHLNYDIWIIDSRATEHIWIICKCTQSPRVPSHAIPIQLPNGHSTIVEVVGHITLNSYFTLHNVLYEPSFHVNLFLVKKLTKQMQCRTFFTPNFWVF